MTNVSAVEKMAELMQQMEENSPRVAALQYCLTQLEARCAELAAENAGLKAAGNKMFLSAISLMEDHELKIDHALDIKDWEKIKTTATDAFLDEVRAQGVEMFADSLGSPYVERGEECYQDGYTHAIERIKSHKALEFAAQIRKGVQS